MNTPQLHRCFCSEFLIRVSSLAHLLLATLLLLPGLVHSQSSQVPNRLSYQGLVTDIGGVPLGDTTPENHEVIFRLWDGPTAAGAANLVYSEKQVVTIANGEFSVLIGAGADVSGEEDKGPGTVNVSDAFDGSQRFLGVTVAAAAAPGGITGSDLEITPRQQLVSTAFSFRAKEAESVINDSVGTSSIADGAITLLKMGSESVNGTSIVDNSITTVDLANGAVSASKLASDVGFWSVGGANVYRPSGTVGIGIASPSTPLYVRTNSSAVAGDSGLTVEQAGGGDAALSLLITGQTRYNIGIDNSDGDKLKIFSDSVNAFGGSGITLDVSGNVGIGTATPNATLDVAGNILTRGRFSTQGDNTAFLLGDSGGAEKGLLGLATGPGAFSSDATGGDVVLRSLTGKILLQSGPGASAIAIDSNNNVGIGALSATSLNSGASRFRGTGRETGLGGCYVEWGNQAPGSFGQTFILNQREGGVHGIFLGELANNGAGTITPSLFTSPATTWMPGSVGIGTDNPTQAKLVVQGALNANIGLLSQFTTGDAAISGFTSSSHPVSIYASDSIWTGSRIMASSDERIKTIDGRSDGAMDLDALLGVEITDYHYKDIVAKGNAPQKKVIAQQVEKVFPLAVSKQTDVVPDVYQLAEIKGSWVSLKTDLKKGDRVKLIGDKSEGIHEVLEVAEGRFRTDFEGEGTRSLCMAARWMTSARLTTMPSRC